MAVEVLLHKASVLLQEARKAAGEWRTGPPDAQAPFLDRHLGPKPRVLGDWLGSPHLHRTEEEAVREAWCEHVAAYLAPAGAEEEENEGCGCGLEADELRHESLRPVQLPRQLATADISGHQKPYLSVPFAVIQSVFPYPY